LVIVGTITFSIGWIEMFIKKDSGKNLHPPRNFSSHNWHALTQLPIDGVRTWIREDHCAFHRVLVSSAQASRSIVHRDLFPLRKLTAEPVEAVQINCACVSHRRRMNTEAGLQLIAL
jgi:hypothetical protein